MSKSHLINANTHRVKEGARVLEDIARFFLRDEKLLREIRDIRHQIHASAPLYDVKEDLGGAGLLENNVRYNLINLIQANSMRMQEALRVLEEMSENLIEKQRMKALRYQAYDFHSKIYYAVKKYLKWDLLRGLYLIIDTNIISTPLEEMIEIINQSAVNVIQYRNKSQSKKQVFEEVYKIKRHLNANKLLIINDHIDIALDLGDGVHLGQADYPLARIRRIIPDNFIFGISCHSLSEAQIATQFNPSYIAIGCLFETQSKHNVVPVSMQELQAVCNQISLPICAIGGINKNNLELVLTANVQMTALISYVWKEANPLEAINAMHERIIHRIK